MSAAVELGDGDRLYLKPERHMLSLYPGVGGVQISLRFEVSRQVDAPDASPFHVSALLFVCRTSGQDQKLVGTLEPTHAIAPQVRSCQLDLAGFISDEQLRVIEELRRGGDLCLSLRLNVTTVDGDPLKLHLRTAQGTFPVGAGEWSAQLEHAYAGTVVEVVVPMILGADYRGAWDELRQARAMLRNNDVKAALISARSTLELVRKSQRTAAVVRAVRKREAEDQDQRPEEKRSLDERFAFTCEALFATLSGAAHRPAGAAKGFEYTRQDAAMLIAAVAGMLARLAEERRQA